MKLFNKNFYIVLIIDVFLLAGSFYAAHLVRFDFNIPNRSYFLFKQALPFVLLIKILCFYFFDLYRGMWRYTSITDLINIIKASSISTIGIICVILFSPTRFIGFSRTMFLSLYSLSCLRWKQGSGANGGSP